jgi:hypothetical protein
MDKLIQAIRESMVAVVAFFFDTVPKWWLSQLESGQQNWETKIERFDDYVATALAGEEIYNDAANAGLRDQFTKMRALPYPFGMIITWLAVMWLAVATMRTWLAGIANLQAQKVNAEIEPNLIPMESLAALAIKYPQLKPTLDLLYDKWGIPENQRALLQLLQQPLPNLGELLSLVNRGELTYEDAAETLSRQGFSGDNATKLLELRNWLPSPQDVVAMAGREAFEEDQIREFSLDQDMPEGMFEWGEKVGVSREVLRLFWIAHWQNPSLSQVFEMIHREVEKPDGSTFTPEDLPIFYRLADVQPFFGDLLRQIAYRPLTRVDVRRMYRMGVLKFDDVEKAYRHLGYSPDNATFMANFAQREKEQTGKNLTRTQLEKLYRIGLLRERELFDQLVVIGYDEDESHQLIDLLDADMDEDRFKKIIRRIEHEYKRKIIDDATARTQLAELELQGLRINQTIDEWDAEAVIEQTLPSKEDLLGWFSAGQIPPGTFRDLMRAKQYEDGIIELYIQGMAARPSKTDLLLQLDRDVIDEVRAREGLAALGYEEEDRNAFIRVIELRKERRAKYAETQTTGNGVG